MGLSPPYYWLVLDPSRNPSIKFTPFNQYIHEILPQASTFMANAARYFVLFQGVLQDLLRRLHHIHRPNDIFHSHSVYQGKLPGANCQSNSNFSSLKVILLSYLPEESIG